MLRRPRIFTLLLCLVGTTVAYSNVVVDGVTLGERELIKGVEVFNARKDKVRIIHAIHESEIGGNIEVVLKNVLHFDQICNNRYKRRRTMSDRSADCKFRSPHLVETKIIKKVKPHGQKLLGEIDRWFLKRVAFNRGTYRQNELVTIQKMVKDNAIQYIVTMRLLSNDEAGKYVDSPLDSNSPFDEVISKFVLTAKGDSKTTIKSYYTSKTDHFILRSSMALGKLYDSVAEGNALSVKAIQQGVEAHQEALKQSLAAESVALKKKTK
ncbi:MAG: hypothetical protein HOE90_05460 [Bacteriovoracaceae bacterium]|jgi:hypothetical protein|nr:hypothetical protein [Bacteriovoracaceae bacterium]